MRGHTSRPEKLPNCATPCDKKGASRKGYANGRRTLMGTKDKGGSKASKKAPQKDIKQKRAAKKSKKGK
jgi:hypothetical protein